MGTDASTAHAQIPPGPLSGASTWLCTFTVLVDMPTTMSIADMEGAVAQGLAVYFNSLGLPGNVSAQLTATAGNVTVLHPTAPVAVATGPVITGSPI